MITNCTNILSDFARLPTVHFSTSVFRWLHQEAWETEQLEYVSSLSHGMSLWNISREIPYSRNKKSGIRAYPGGMWIYERLSPDSTSKIRSLCWTQLYERQFKTLMLFVMPLSHGDWNFEPDHSALSFMVSGLSIISDADLVKLVPLGFEPGKVFDPWGVRTEAISPRSVLPDFGSNSWSKHCLLTIDAHRWWQLENGRRDKEQLSYLIKRVHPPTPRASKFSGILDVFRRRYR